MKQPKLLEIIKFPLLFVGLLWLLHLVQLALGDRWGFLGVFPRSVEGLKGILFAPLIHSGFPHLLSNSIPMLMLGGIIFYFYKRVALRSFILIYFLTGFVVWALANFDEPRSYHIGASGVVYGLVAFVFWMGIFRRSLRSIILALIVTVMYSGYFAGILPDQEGISWESHLYGAFVGIFTAYFYKEELELEEEEEANYAPFANEPERAARPHFLPRDAFEKTRQQREQERLQQNNSGWISDSTLD